MSERDETTTSESFSSSSRPKRANVVIEPDPESTPQAQPSVNIEKDISSIHASVATIRAQTANLPNSDMLATILLSVAAIENALNAIAEGLANLETALAEEEQPA